MKEWKIECEGEVITNYNDPFPFWKKKLIRSSRLKNASKQYVVHYEPPNGAMYFTCITHVKKFAAEYSLPHFHDWFDFSALFCTCHTHENGLYVACGYGKGGCNGWIHPQCVGLGHMSESEIQSSEFVYICPLCVNFLEKRMELHKYVGSNTRLLRTSTSSIEKKQIQVPAGAVMTFSDSTGRLMKFEEFASPHFHWGLQSYPFVFPPYKNTTQFEHHGHSLLQHRTQSSNSTSTDYESDILIRTRPTFNYLLPSILQATSSAFPKTFQVNSQLPANSSNSLTLGSTQTVSSLNLVKTESNTGGTPFVSSTCLGDYSTAQKLLSSTTAMLNSSTLANQHQNSFNSTVQTTSKPKVGDIKVPSHILVDILRSQSTLAKYSDTITKYIGKIDVMSPPSVNSGTCPVKLKSDRSPMARSHILTVLPPSVGSGAIELNPGTSLVSPGMANLCDLMKIIFTEEFLISIAFLTINESSLESCRSIVLEELELQESQRCRWVFNELVDQVVQEGISNIASTVIWRAEFGIRLISEIYYDLVKETVTSDVSCLVTSELVTAFELRVTLLHDAVIESFLADDVLNVVSIVVDDEQLLDRAMRRVSDAILAECEQHEFVQLIEDSLVQEERRRTEEITEEVCTEVILDMVTSLTGVELEIAHQLKRLSQGLALDYIDDVIAELLVSDFTLELTTQREARAVAVTAVREGALSNQRRALGPSLDFKRLRTSTRRGRKQTTMKYLRFAGGWLNAITGNSEVTETWQQRRMKMRAVMKAGGSLSFCSAYRRIIISSADERVKRLCTRSDDDEDSLLDADLHKEYGPQHIFQLPLRDGGLRTTALPVCTARNLALTNSAGSPDSSLLPHLAVVKRSGDVCEESLVGKRCALCMGLLIPESSTDGIKRKAVKRKSGDGAESALAESRIAVLLSNLGRYPDRDEKVKRTAYYIHKNCRKKISRYDAGRYPSHEGIILGPVQPVGDMLMTEPDKLIACLLCGRSFGILQSLCFVGAPASHVAHPACILALSRAAHSTQEHVAIVKATHAGDLFGSEQSLGVVGRRALVDPEEFNCRNFITAMKIVDLTVVVGNVIKEIVDSVVAVADTVSNTALPSQVLREANKRSLFDVYQGNSLVADAKSKRFKSSNHFLLAPTGLPACLKSTWGKYQCKVCSGYAGFTIRCASPKCCVRCHPLCALLINCPLYCSTAPDVNFQCPDTNLDLNKGERNSTGLAIRSSTLTFLCRRHMELQH